jgi:hypothetical protein
MKILVNAVNNRGWFVHCIADDCRTVLSPITPVESLAVLRKLLRCAGASDAEMKEFEGDVGRWSHGSCWISDLTPRGAELLRIDIKTLARFALRD